MDSAAEPRDGGVGGDDSVELYTGDGEKVLVSRERWKEALPSYFEDAAEDADETYKLIVLSLRDGFYAECIEPAKRLLKIDSDKERAANILGVVLLKNGMLEEAEKVLSGYLNGIGPSGAIMTNLAKVYDKKGEGRKAYKTLWGALLADPNQENALAWWYSIHRGPKEKQRLDESLVKLAELPGSWRPVAYLAVRSFEEKEPENGLMIMGRVLEIAGDVPDALVIVSGELAGRGYAREALDMVYPLYEPRRHGHAAGMNLIKACVELREKEKGLALCDSVEALGRADIIESLRRLREKLRNI